MFDFESKSIKYTISGLSRFYKKTSQSKVNKTHQNKYLLNHH